MSRPSSPTPSDELESSQELEELEAQSNQPLPQLLQQLQPEPGPGPEPTPVLPPLPLKDIYTYRHNRTFARHSYTPYASLQSNLYPPNVLHTQILTEYLPIIERILTNWIEKKRRERGRYDLSSPWGEGRIINSYEILRSFLNEAPHLEGNELARAYMLIEPLLPEDLKDEINERYAETGYTYCYFGWVDDQNPYVQAMLGQIPLTPATFEVAATLPLVEYQRITHAIEDGPKARNNEPLSWWLQRGPTRNHPDHNGPFNIGHFGWTKEALVGAIRREITRLGLPVEVKSYEDPPRVWTTIARHTIFPGAGGKMPGILMPSAAGQSKRGYLETVYRKLANTLTRFNWSQVCSNQEIPLNTLRFIAVNDFHIDLRTIFPLGHEDLCERLEQESNRRLSVREQLGEAIPEAALTILYQPGSRWVQPETRQYFRPPEPHAEIFPAAYAEILQTCRDLSNVPKGYLIFLISRLGAERWFPRDLTQVSKEDICRSLVNYLRVLRGQR
jgi:hypothetical protein